MKRERHTETCPTCGEDQHDCLCPDMVWVPVKGVKADKDDLILIKKAGIPFREITDTKGDVYYVGPWSHNIWFYPDGTWNGSKAGRDLTLEQYLDWCAENLKGA